MKTQWSDLPKSNPIENNAQKCESRYNADKRYELKSFISRMKIKTILERIVFSNQFGTLFNDKVEFQNTQGTYLRWQWNTDRAVVVVPKLVDKYAFLQTYRYPISAMSIEFPRGAVEKRESLFNAAKRELQEELGLQGINAQSQGIIQADSGLITTPCHVIFVDIEPSSLTNISPQHESMEAIHPSTVWLNADEVKASIIQGNITCALSIAAFTLTEVNIP
ncbi:MULTISPECIES: NUDIX hydrolase [Cyanophyceae]|uniref:NUDIX hydrolase n=1 Tax=Cyanophyceae TaxID=3028117 RepID=UPI0006743B91|nr:MULTISPECIES: NUDIX hydrolase [Cyanophyceae]SMH42332.1 8-oxo-dGTP pyrophosphatase MutT, NUDIX family [Picosynechococcus sp. OG1]SMQ78737.1 8-oxo-dGTP pyrophosphatase MutT, NUDIX family [Synechococcus sp. 7002]